MRDYARFFFAARPPWFIYTQPQPVTYTQWPGAAAALLPPRGAPRVCLI